MQIAASLAFPQVPVAASPDAKALPAETPAFSKQIESAIAAQTAGPPNRSPKTPGLKESAPEPSPGIVETSPAELPPPEPAADESLNEKLLRTQVGNWMMGLLLDATPPKTPPPPQEGEFRAEPVTIESQPAESTALTTPLPASQVAPPGPLQFEVAAPAATPVEHNATTRMPEPPRAPQFAAAAPPVPALPQAATPDTAPEPPPQPDGLPQTRELQPKTPPRLTLLADARGELASVLAQPPAFAFQATWRETEPGQSRQLPELATALPPAVKAMPTAEAPSIRAAATEVTPVNFVEQRSPRSDPQPAVEPETSFTEPATARPRVAPASPDPPAESHQSVRQVALRLAVSARPIGSREPVASMEPPRSKPAPSSPAMEPARPLREVSEAKEALLRLSEAPAPDSAPAELKLAKPAPAQPPASGAPRPPLEVDAEPARSSQASQAPIEPQRGREMAGDGPALASRGVLSRPLPTPPRPEPAPEPTGSNMPLAAEGLTPRIAAARPAETRQPAAVVTGRPGGEPLVETGTLRTAPSGSQLDLLLRPEHLGRVAVRLIERAGVVEVAVRTDNQPARAWLAESLPSLVDHLNERGFEITRLARGAESGLNWWAGEQQGKGGRDRREPAEEDNPNRPRPPLRGGAARPVFSIPV